MGYQIHRVYEGRGPAGRRVLVDRLWPRGLTKTEVGQDEWMRDVAPSTELRRWYGHDVARFDEFASRYRAELAALPASAAVAHLHDMGEEGSVVLLTATRDVAHSGARVLLDHLVTQSSSPGRGRR